MACSRSRNAFARYSPTGRTRASPRRRTAPGQRPRSGKRLADALDRCQPGQRSRPAGTLQSHVTENTAGPGREPHWHRPGLRSGPCVPGLRPGRSEVGPAAFAFPGHPLDGQHAARVERVPPVIPRDLNEPVGAEPHAEQRMLVVVQGPPRAQSLEHEPDLPRLADHRLQQIRDYLAVHSATLLAGFSIRDLRGHRIGHRGRGRVKGCGHMRTQFDPAVTGSVWLRLAPQSLIATDLSYTPE